MTLLHAQGPAARRARPWTDLSQPDGRRARRRPRGRRSSAAARTSSPAGRTPRSTPSPTPERGAGRDALLHAGALQPHGPDGAVRAARRRGRHPPRRGRRLRIRTRCRRARARLLRERGIEVTTGVLAREAERLNAAVLHRDATRAPVRHDEDRDQRGRQDRGRSRRADRCSPAPRRIASSIASAPRWTRSRSGPARSSATIRC